VLVGEIALSRTIGVHAMLKGTVKFRARIVDSNRGLTIPENCEFVPKTRGVGKVGIICQDGKEILITVHFSAAESKEAAIAVATQIQNSSLDRISFERVVAIVNGRADPALFPVDAQRNVLSIDVGDYVYTGNNAKLSTSLTCGHLNEILERPAPQAREDYYGFVRSALLSTSPVEEFMHLYNILLMLFGDAQTCLDKFIVEQNSAVEQTKQPPIKRRRRPKLKQKIIYETVYTRLRDELGHKRVGVNLDATKAEMRQHLNELIDVVKRAIERSNL